MLFNTVDFNDTITKITSTIDANCEKASVTRREIEKLKKQNVNNDEERKLEIFETDEIVEEKESIDDEFEDEIDFYLNDYLYISDNFTMDELINILPNKNNYRFNDIIMRLYAESLKAMNEYRMFAKDGDNSKEDLAEISKALVTEKRKMSCLLEIINHKDDINEKDNKNKLFLIPNSTGSVKILDDLRSEDASFYPSFLELINSIEDGTFKNVKKFKNNNDLVGVCEVKGYQVRVVFARIDKDTYGLITALVKKQDNDSNYRNFLKKRISEYRKVCPSLKKYISDEKIMAENSDNLAELYNILGVAKENGVEKKKGGKND